MANQFILSLSDRKAKLALVGGKGASLARLAKAGFPVPDGFHITTAAYRRFVEENALKAIISSALKTADAAQPETLEKASQTIRAAFQSGVIPKMIASAVANAYQRMMDSGSAVAVRSSATAEDLPDLSFAGQQETFLNIKGTDEVLSAVKKCWASLWTARAIGYRLRNNIDQKTVSLAVVVQALVPAKSAGILFTANPLNGQRGQMVVNSSWGLGEAVVDGQVTPDNFIVDKERLAVISREIAEKQTATIGVDGGTRQEPLPEEKRNAPSLADAQVIELARLGRDIESLYQMPMDIEWAFAGGKFSILQARPITALPQPSADPPSEWRVPFGHAWFTRGSIIEQLPDPASPLFADLAPVQISKSIKDLIMQVFGTDRFSGTMDFLTINNYFYMYIKFGGAKILRLYLRSIPALFGGIFRDAATYWSDTLRPRYLKTISDWQARSPDEMKSEELLTGASELLFRGAQLFTGVQLVMALVMMSEPLFTRFYQKRVQRSGDPPAQAFLLGFDSHPILAEKSLFDLARWTQKQKGLANLMLQTPSAQFIQRLRSPRAPRGIQKESWLAWRSRFQDYLDQFGHAIYNLDFVNSVPADDPIPLMETLKFYLSGQGADPYQRQKKAVQLREQAAREISARLGPLRRSIFHKLLAWAQKYAPIREDSLAAVGLGWPLLRKLLLELGHRLAESGMLAEKEDIFWLNEKEAKEAAAALDSGQKKLEDRSGRVIERKMVWRGQKRAVPPQFLPREAKVLKLLERFLPAGRSDQVGPVIKGVPVSPGEVTAPARVMHSPEDFSDMRPGDILVAGITTPAWTPLFAMASAVVTDVGGPLSHGSIVAREYGIPAVLGTGIATKRIRSGQLIRVNGSAGTVTILDELSGNTSK